MTGPTGAAATTNREAMESKLADLDAEHAKAVAGGGERYVDRHHARGRLLPRERIELLVDEGSAFLELSPLAAYGTDFAVGASLVTGIGVVSGVECLITANDPTVKGGASNPWTLRKAFRASQIAEENGLPTISLVESGGADLPTQKEIFIPGGRMFRDLTRASARKQPTIALVFGSSTAGGAYIPGMSDYTVMVKEQAKVFLGGPPLVKMATGEESDEESLGGAEMHARVSGLADHLAADERDAIRIGRRIVARLNHRKRGGTSSEPWTRLPASHDVRGYAEPDADPEELLDLVPADLSEPFDPREVVARVCDGVSEHDQVAFDEFKPLYGTSLVTGWARIHGRPVGILANAQGVLFSEEAQKATQFIQLANQSDTPLLFLHNTTGYMVGAEYEQGGIIKHGAMMINAVSNSTVPHLSVVMGASYGAGNYGMNGRAFDPRFLFTWPSAKSAVMGPAQLAGVLSIVARAAAGAKGTDVRRGGGRRDAGLRRAAGRGGLVAVRAVGDGLRRRRHRPARHPHGARHLPVGDREPAVVRRRAVRGVPAVSTTITRLMVANRAEIASRVFRTCRRLGIETVAVHSDSDAGLPYVAEADAAVRLPGDSPAETYLRADLLVEAALRAGADAVHPGYGFLSENAAFARAVIDAGLTWVGPRPESIEAMGDKVRAKEIVRAAGVPVLEAPDDPTADDLPLIVKAAAGGGGRGMRIVRDLADLDREVEAARAEAASAFGDGTVFVEPYVEHGRHVEVQVVGSSSYGDRDCSVQRRHQKVVEEAPAPALDDEVRQAMHAAARAAAEAIDYRSAGTVEFLLDPVAGRFFFLEMNTRLQVEHPVTEVVQGVDLVELQLRDAESGWFMGWGGEPVGHAIEVRLYAEDPANGYQPQSGTLTAFDIPAEDGVRVEAGYAAGDTVSTHYDAMLAKVVVHAPDRTSAARRLAGVLRRSRIHGVTTNRDQLVAVLTDPDFLAEQVSTAFLDEHPPAPVGAHDAAAAVAAALALAERSRERRTVQQGIPVGWRNVVSAPQVTTFRGPEGGDDLAVAWHGGRDGYAVDGHTVLAASPRAVMLETGGVATTYEVAVTDAAVDVDSPRGHVRLVPVPRFTDPADAVASGSLLAPMPGSVVKVHVEQGQQVAAGDPVLVLEAMKMQHTVTAPHAGTVTALDVRPGAQVAAGEVLAVVEEA